MGRRSAEDAPKRLNTKNRSTAPDIDVIGGGIRGGCGQQTDRIAITRKRRNLKINIAVGTE
jgi:hypothetical protein